MNRNANLYTLALMLAIQRARAEGFTHYADALTAVLKRELNHAN